MHRITETDTQRVFDFFEEISQIPRISGSSGKIADYLESFAKSRGLFYKRDSNNNVIVRKSATRGYENASAVIFQSHTDMVGDKVAGSNFDFQKDGVSLCYDGDFIRADGTTLGADDGIGMAYALAVLDSKDIEHPEIEALFTSDEEIGLIGAAAFDTSELHGRWLINIDSDEEGVFTVGCAGGERVDVSLPYKPDEVVDSVIKIKLSGLIGGHSGVEIDKGRENAIKILAEILSACDDLRICDFSGGSADNAIPSFAECAVLTHNRETLLRAIKKMKERISNKEPSATFYIEDVEDETRSAYSIENSARILEIVSDMPTGVYKMSEDIQGLVETSSNLGVVGVSGGRVTLAVSVRSSKNSEKSALCDRIFDIAKCFSAETSARGEYPAWEYKKDSELCDVMKRVYLDTFGREPTVMVIHAGLECGIFSQKIEGFDCVSLGPNGFDIHTTDERLSISSTVRVYDYLIKVLKSI